MEDLEGILHIERASFPSPWSEEVFFHEMQNRLSTILVAKRRSGKGWELLSYLCFWIMAEECHILNLATHPEFRRQGTASLLLAHTLSHCTDKGIKRVFLEVRNSNVPAQSLYQKHGFQTDYIRKDYYTDTCEDALVMALEL